MCFRELEELLNQFFLSRSLDAFKSSYGLVLPTNVRETLFCLSSWRVLSDHTAIFATSGASGEP